MTDETTTVPDDEGPAQTDNRPRPEDGPQDDVSQDPHAPYLGAEAEVPHAGAAVSA